MTATRTHACTAIGQPLQILLTSKIWIVFCILLLKISRNSCSGTCANADLQNESHATLSHINVDLCAVPQELEPRTATSPDSTLVFSPQSRVQLKSAVDARVKLSPKGKCSDSPHKDVGPATTSAKRGDLVATLRKQLDALKTAREEERKGRIKAERALRQVSLELAERDGYTFKPIGIVRSCFPDRRGTPRQPTLCPVV